MTSDGQTTIIIVLINSRYDSRFAVYAKKYDYQRKENVLTAILI